MTRLSMMAITIGIVLTIIGSVYWYSHHRENQVRQDAKNEQKINDLTIKDSSNIAGFNAINKKVDTLSNSVATQTANVRVITRKIPVPVYHYDTLVRVDSVFADSSFARLSSDQKIEVLRLAALKQANTCSILATTCQQARDSAKKVFVSKDSLIDLWHDRFNNKPRRRCGIGATLGIGAGVNSSFTPQAIVGVMAGLTCNF